MEYFLGLLTAIVLFLCGYICYVLGKKQSKNKEHEPDYLAEQRKKELEEIFSYNLNKAIKGVDK